MRENGIPYKTSRRASRRVHVGHRPGRHRQRGRRDRRGRNHEKRREAHGRRRERDLRGHGRQSGRRLHGRRFHHGRRRAVRRRPAGRNPILDEPGQGHGQVKPAGPYRQRQLRLSIRAVMDGTGGFEFEQKQQGQAVRHHQSQYRQIRFGMRHVHHRQGHSQLEQVEFRLELHPGRRALSRHELRGRQCGTQLRFRPPQPVRRTDRRPAGHRDLPGCEGHAGHHDEMESEAFQRDQRLRGQDAGHDRRTIQGDRAGGHPYRVRERQQGR